MLLVSLLIGLLLLSIITAIICHVIANKTWSDTAEGLRNIFVGISLVIGAFTLITTSSAISVKVNEEIEFKKTLYTKEALEQRLEQSENLSNGNEMLYSEITEFNNDLREIKYWSQNPWIGYKYNQRIAQEIDYIIIPGVDNEKTNE